MAALEKKNITSRSIFFFFSPKKTRRRRLSMYLCLLGPPRPCRRLVLAVPPKNKFVLFLVVPTTPSLRLRKYYAILIKKNQIFSFDPLWNGPSRRTSQIFTAKYFFFPEENKSQESALSSPVSSAPAAGCSAGWAGMAGPAQLEPTQHSMQARHK